MYALMLLVIVGDGGERGARGWSTAASSAIAGDRPAVTMTEKSERVLDSCSSCRILLVVAGSAPARPADRRALAGGRRSSRSREAVASPDFSLDVAGTAPWGWTFYARCCR